jgi:hypothetical protein
MRTKKSYLIHESNLSKVQVKVDMLNIKARKKGLPQIKFEIMRPVMKEIEPNVLVRYFRVHVEYEPMKYNGWVYVARIIHTPEGNLFQTVPFHYSLPVPEKYRNADPNCEHCKINRKRRDTYVVYHQETDTWKQIGSSCIKDFIGEDLPKLTPWKNLDKQLTKADNEDVNLSLINKRYLPLKLVVALTLKYVQTHGWVPKSKDVFLSTANNVEHLLTLPKETENINYEKAEEVIAWVRSKNFDQSNEFYYNLMVVAKNDNIEYRMIPLACCLVKIYNQHHKTKTNSKSTYVGKIGERGDFTLTVNKKVSLGDMYGRVMYLLQDRNENVFKWITNKTLSFEEIKVKATIKEHKDYNGTKQTVITRGSLV